MYPRSWEGMTEPKAEEEETKSEKTIPVVAGEEVRSKWKCEAGRLVFGREMKRSTQTPQFEVSGRPGVRASGVGIHPFTPLCTEPLVLLGTEYS